MRKPLLLLSLALIAIISCQSKRTATKPTNTNTYKDPRWARVDSLADIGQYETALTLTDTILAGARRTNDWQLEFHAMMKRGSFRQMTGTEQPEVIKEFEARSSTAPFPLDALLHSVIADQYWSYYQSQRWVILERTATQDDPNDVATWSQPTFVQKVIAEYRASLMRIDSLKTVPVGDLEEILMRPENASLVSGAPLRPTLFDVLAQRALSVFTNSETRLAEPAWRFKLDDPRHFALFEDFASRPLVSKDSTSWEFQAMRLYQELERFHLNDTRPDALVDVTVDRLEFVHGHTTLPQKDTLHLNALTTLRSRVLNDSCWSEVTLALAQWHLRMSNKYQRLGGDAWKWEKRTARDLCKEAIARYPGSLGAHNAAVMLDRLEQPQVNVDVEQAVMPDRAFKIAVNYMNAPHVWLRLVEDKRTVESSDWFRGDRTEELTTAKPLREWNVQLPDDGDLNQHIVELAVEGLPFGHYALLVSDSSRFLHRTDLITLATFWVARLSIADRSEGETLEALVLDRWSGQPKGGLKLNAYMDSWANGGRQLAFYDSFTTDADGFIRAQRTIPDSRNFIWQVSEGKDQFISSAHYMYRGGRGEDHRDSITTYFFTDRAIYRPGQPIHFKGIVTTRKGSNNKVLPNYKTEVMLENVNGDNLDTLTVTTDAFGAFHGTFAAPQGGLTGLMTLYDDHGQCNIRVEEYKRPTFEVTFDPISGQPKLGQQAKVSGVAKSYAGVPLDGATVQWTVNRSAIMPWWLGWYYRGWLPWGRETQVAQGTAVCDAEGKFTAEFLAQADDQFPRASDPTFNFSVSASITDISGETQSGNTSLSLGYRSINIELGFGESLDRGITDSVDVRVENLNGERVDVPLDIRVFRLQAPVRPLRARVWDRPDRFLLTREEHAQRFPEEVYADENDPLTWTKGTEVFQERGHVSAGKRLSVREMRGWEVGSYVMEASAMDASGAPVKVSKVFTVFDRDIQNSGWVNEPFHAEMLTPTVEPGEKAMLLLGTALPDARVLMEVERDGRIVVTRWMALKQNQQRVELPVMESDRGGFGVHLICVERGQVHSSTQWFNVPWTNKQLQVEWMSFRDKLQPGDNEEWRLKITGPKKEQVAAQMLGAMYDASLDDFVQHSWNMSVWHDRYAERSWQRQEPFGRAQGQAIWRQTTAKEWRARAYPELDLFGLQSVGGYGRYTYATDALYDRSADGADQRLETMQIRGARAEGSVAYNMGFAAPAKDKPMAGEEEKMQQVVVDESGNTTSKAPSGPPPLRSDFRETAFFFPDLLTDRDGSVVLRFKTPDALTRWKVMGLAHTKDLKLAQFTRETVTQKPLMVVPNLPRFLRSGDRITLTAKINVLEKGRAEGLASLELFDPFTNAPLNKSFGLVNGDVSFIAAIGNSAAVEWEIKVPEGVEVCGVRVSAKTKGGPQSTIVAADGEERALPVLTDKVLVTESLPLWASKAGTKTFTFDKLKNSTSTTLRNRSLKLEYTPNPAWYAVQALPYMMEFPHECAEQIFSRYYANRLAGHIVEERPVIKKVFEQWKAAGPAAFASNLEKNADLKNVLLAETPWVVNARSDRERKERIGLLFDMQRMAGEEATALKKLRDMQLPNGAWPWWNGMQESRWITQHIVAGMGHLEQLKAADLREDGQSMQMVRNAVRWLDQDVAEDYQRMLRDWKKEDLEKYRPGYTEIQYLYARSMFKRWPIDGGTRTAANFYQERIAKEWLSYGLQEQAMIALMLHRSNDHTTAALIIESLKQRATKSEELGMYWKNFNSGMSWSDFPTETHALMIEAFHEVAKDEASVNALRTYLLKLKQTTDWKTTKATAEACYALLLTGSDWLSEADVPVITVGSEEIKIDKQQASTGTIERSWNGNEVKPVMAEVTITSKANKPSWGALHWQYFEQMDKVTPHESPFSIKKQVMLTEQGDQGPKLIALDKSRKLKAGDKLTIRIELRTDRWVDYVHMKDLRASGLEPTETLSGYKYQGGLGYYQSIRDASINFFFDRIGPGTYVFEYTLRVTHSGDFSNGITTAMCMYAPEFSSHSEGVRVTVGE